MSNFLELVGLTVSGGVVVVIAAVALPLGCAVSGYFTGWILDSVFPFAGDWVTAGVVALGIEVVREQLPVVGAFLGFVGSFFRTIGRK